MASYMSGDEMMGGKVSNFMAKFDITSKKRRKAMLKDIANLDPTSSTAAYGKVVKAGIIGGLNLIPVIGTPLSVAAGAGFMLKASADQAKRTKAAQQQAIIQNASVPTPASPEIGPAGAGSTEQKKSSFLIPALVGVGAIAAATMM